MKKLLFFLVLLVVNVTVFSQGQPFPNYQPQGSATTRWSQQGAVQAIKGIINGVYPDTATANIGYIDFYPGAQIFTTNDKVIWVRDYPAYRWVRQDPSITSFTFNTDSSVTICFGSGVCQTVSVNNFTNIVNNLIQNFNDSTIYKINDTTLLFCTGPNSCDTIHLGNSFTYYIAFDSISNNYYIVTCDTVQAICVGDSCYQQQVCDSILIPRPTSPVYQNLLQKIPGTNLIEAGNFYAGANTFGDMIHDTYFNLNYHQLMLYGARQGSPPLAINQYQWSQIGSSVTSFQHNGAYAPTYNLLDENNPVKLYVNYSDPFYKMTEGALTGDTLGFLGNEYGYMIMTNSSGFTQHYTLDDVNAKQTGVALFTYGTSNRAVGIFGNQVPASYGLSTHPPTDSTLLDAMIAVFKTNGQQQLPQYISGAFEDANPLYIIAQDADGNLVQYPPGGMGGTNPFENIANASLTADANYTQNWAGFRLRFDSTSFVTMNTKAGETSGQMWRARFELDEDISFWEIRNRSTASRIETGLDLTTGDPSWYALANNYNTTKIFGVRADTTETGLYYSTTNILLPDRYWRVTSTAVQADGLSVGASTDSVLVWNAATKDVGYRAASSFGGGVVDANNGLSIYQDTIVQLFGPVTTPATLLDDRYLNQSTFVLYQNGVVNDFMMRLHNTHASGGGLYGQADGGPGLYGQSNTGDGVIGQSTTGIGVQGSSTIYGVYGITTTNGVAIYGSATNGTTPGLGGTFEVSDNTTNNIAPIVKLKRTNSSGTPAAGVGGSIEYYLRTSTGSSQISNTIQSQWVVATHASRTSQLDVTGINSTAGTTIASFYGSGVVGIGILSSYTATRLNVVDDAISTTPMVNLTSTSTGAASDLQKVLNVSLSGANVNSGQDTYCINVENTHTGSSSSNYGLVARASGGTTNVGVGSVVTGTGTSAAFYGTNAAAGYVAWFQATTSGTAVFAETASGTSVSATSNSGTALYGLANGTNTAAVLINGGEGYALTANSNYSSLNSAQPVSKFSRGLTSGIAADGIGGIINLESVHTDGTSTAAQILWKWTTAANASRESSLILNAVHSTATVDVLTLAGDGSVKLRPITATAASAITAAEGMLVFVSDTNGTFTSIGIWCYQNGAWKAL